MHLFILLTISLFYLCGLILVATSPIYEGKEFQFPHPDQADFVQHLTTFDIATPVLVDEVGNYLSHDLKDWHRMSRRDTLSHKLGKDSQMPHTMHYKIKINDDDNNDDAMVHLELTRNDMLLSPGFVVERRPENSTLSDFTIRKIPKDHCHYVGKLRQHADSALAMSLCQGLTGVIRKGKDEYFIEPVLGHDLKKEPRHPHIIYKRSALSASMGIDESNKNYCGISESRSDTTKNGKDSDQRKKTGDKVQHRRDKRSVSYNSNVEVLVVADESMVNYYHDQNLETYVLTIMNIVTSLYNDASLGNFVNVVMVKLMLLESNPDDLVVMHHADKTLDSFCKWQLNINPKEDDHPNHHDVAVLLTKKDLCQGINEPCSTLGLAHVNGMCQPHRSCSVNEDSGLSLAYTVAHEIGHNFGMQHDGADNDCAPSSSHDIHMMSPLLTMDSTPMTWSRCSRQYITKFFDRGWGECLQDEPRDHQFAYPLVPPGVMYDADHQCQLQYGMNASLCESLADDVCTTLWCRVDGNMCHSKLNAAAAGTSCGQHKLQWCYSGECVDIAEPPQSINGGWGPWSDWSECSRSCGGGVAIKHRLCNNPTPSNGGKYCIGERKKYAICKRESCPADSPDIRSVQCSSFNKIPYDENYFTWMPYIDKVSPCELHCRPKDNYFAAKLANQVINGTPCAKGTRDICIEGVCQHVGCDFRINSDAKEDQCGVCHGDGRSCEMVTDKFTKESGIGYVEAKVIPVGARNIRVEEVAAASNYLALMNTRGQYILNGNWYIQWSGDYEVAGTTVSYERVDNKESVFAPGPLQEPLHVMLLFQSPNPGVDFEYTVPKPANETILRIKEFSWHFGDWSPCSVTCGAGTQRSAVICVEVIAGIVEDTYCNGTKPDDKQRTCNQHQCPATWWIGPWQHCSVTCGLEGLRQRSVFCIRGIGDDEQIALTENDCLQHGLEKPDTHESCNSHVTCPTRSDWTTGNWSECSTTCGRGIQHRIVSCNREDELCDLTHRPDSKQSCIGQCDKTNGWIIADENGNKKPQQYQADYHFSYEDTWSDAESYADQGGFSDHTGYKQVPLSFGEWEKMKSQRAGKMTRGQLVMDMMRNGWQHPGRTSVTENVYHSSFMSDVYGTNYDSETSYEETTENIGNSIVEHINVDHEDVIVDVNYPQIDPDGFILKDDTRLSELNNEFLITSQSIVTSQHLTTLPSTIKADDVVSLEYDLRPTEISIETSTITQSHSYKWMASQWTQCSATCGSGYKTRNVYCLDLTINLPATHGCVEPKPVDTTTCLLPDCPQPSTTIVTTQKPTTTVNVLPTTMSKSATPSPDCKDVLGAILCNAVQQANKCANYDYHRYCCATCYYASKHR